MSRIVKSRTAGAKTDRVYYLGVDATSPSAGVTKGRPRRGGESLDLNGPRVHAHVNPISLVKVLIG